MSVTGKVGKAIKSRLTKGGPIAPFKDAGESNFYNAYTGLQTTKATGFAVTGVAGAYAGIASHPAIVSHKRQSNAAKQNMHYVGAPPAQQADGVMNAPTLGASGDMVFGLNNMRRG